MQTVVETAPYLAAAKNAGMTEAEMVAVVDAIAANPSIGDVIVGSGGCRKVRFAGRGKGKSGGYRVVTFYTGQDVPAFLLTVFGKGAKANLSKAETNGLAKFTTILVAQYRKGARK